jgi:tRNA dimethylallyltransferase
MDAEMLRKRIEERTDAWLASGWVDEVRSLIAAGFGSARAMSSVGFKDIAESLADPSVDLRARIVQHTRIFARRQRTWLNHEPVRYV